MEHLLQEFTEHYPNTLHVVWNVLQLLTNLYFVLKNSLLKLNKFLFMAFYLPYLVKENNNTIKIIHATADNVLYKKKVITHQLCAYLQYAWIDDLGGIPMDDLLKQFHYLDMDIYYYVGEYNNEIKHLQLDFVKNTFILNGNIEENILFNMVILVPEDD